MPPPSQVRMWQPSVHLLPAEILSIIFLLVVENWWDSDRMQLMLVCRRWYAIMLSTPGIPSRLLIRNSTTIKMVRAAIQRTKWLLIVVINVNDESIDFNEDAFDACIMAAIKGASTWRRLEIHSFPRLRKRKTFPIIVPPLKNLEWFWLGQPCDLGSSFEPLMTAITTTTTSHLEDMNLANVNTLLYLAQPNCLHVFSSLTTLAIPLSKRMESPADILPHLQRLEDFQARHLHLPFYPPDAPLPLTQTLRHLTLKSVSIQWMAGKFFLCSIHATSHSHATSILHTSSLLLCPLAPLLNMTSMTLIPSGISMIFHFID